MSTFFVSGFTGIWSVEIQMRLTMHDINERRYRRLFTQNPAPDLHSSFLYGVLLQARQHDPTPAPLDLHRTLFEFENYDSP